MVDPLMIDVPERIETARLVLRRPRRGDGPRLNAAVLASLDELRPWSGWAQTAPSLDDSESYVRLAHARFEMRIELMFHIRLASDGDDGPLAGAISLTRMDWGLPRFEIGYWRCSSFRQRGVMTEAVTGLSRMAFDALGAKRVEIRMDTRNEPSWRVAERAGFTLDGVLRRERVSVSGETSDTRVYSRVRGVEE